VLPAKDNPTFPLSHLVRIFIPQGLDDDVVGHPPRPRLLFRNLSRDETSLTLPVRGGLTGRGMQARPGWHPVARPTFRSASCGTQKPLALPLAGKPASESPISCSVSLCGTGCGSQRCHTPLVAPRQEPSPGPPPQLVNTDPLQQHRDIRQTWGSFGSQPRRLPFGEVHERGGARGRRGGGLCKRLLRSFEDNIFFRK